MKKRSMLLALSLILGVGDMMSQNISSGQMDERFNDNKLPYGWFTEGWTVDSTGVIRTKASSGFSFDLGSLIGGNDKKEDPESTGSEDPEGTGRAENQACPLHRFRGAG